MAIGCFHKKSIANADIMHAEVFAVFAGFHVITSNTVYLRLGKMAIPLFVYILIAI